MGVKEYVLIFIDEKIHIKYGFIKRTRINTLTDCSPDIQEEESRIRVENDLLSFIDEKIHILWPC